MMYLLTVAAFILASTSITGATADRSSLFDINAACDLHTDTRNKQLIKSKSPDPGDQEDLCVDKAARVSSLPIVSVDLGHNKITDGYALRLHVDPARSAELHDFSTKNLGKELVLIKGDSYVFRARVYAPIDQGAILLIVPDKDFGIRLAKILFNKLPSMP